MKDVELDVFICGA